VLPVGFCEMLPLRKPRLSWGLKVSEAVVQ